ncbi:MAG TPA: NAD(P)/FAD-dependent oxidoreductase [Streptosporangiaceae bacterium]|jgi:2-polyprenyl-6-methoxyphenol hydroxylase-like FAD-dependent oxidoreductase
MTERLHVLVIGGGIGGLCLAHGLRRNGVSVAVYERTETRTDWLQGYRIHISPRGARALHDCLPPELWKAFLTTAGTPAAGFGFLTHKLRDLLFLDESLIAGDARDAADRHHSISRITLRNVLLSGLDDVLHLGKEFTRYEQAADGTVTAHFADGTSATGDVLVAADGANSRVRQQYLPRAQRIDTGIVAIAGKVPLTDHARAWMPSRLSTSVNNIMPPKDSFMFTAVWEGDRARLDPPPGVSVDTTQDYVFWAYAAKRDAYPDGALDTDDGPALRALTQRMIGGWHPDLLHLVAESDPGTVAPVVVRSMAPVPAWKTTTVTLLGDAIHNMTPMAGIGANTALRDADLLCRKLTAADRGEAALLPAIAEYEAAMRDYGFAAVKLSLRNARQATAPSRLARAAFKAVLRAVNAIPVLKRQFARSMNS